MQNAHFLYIKTWTFCSILWFLISPFRVEKYKLNLKWEHFRGAGHTIRAVVTEMI